MPVQPPFDDDVLGRVTWIAEGDCWEFDAGPINGQSVPSSYIPEGRHLTPTEYDWDRLRACVLWIRGNEPVIQAFIKNWVDNLGAPVFSDTDALRLSGIIFHKNQLARVIYNDFFDAVCVDVNSEGRIITPPAWIARK